MTRALVGSVALLVSFGLALVTLSPTAEAQDVLPGVFGEVLDVRVVNVEVVVTDKKGIRVQGLGPEAFQLFVDGKEVPIDYFTEVAFGEAVARDGDTDGPAPMGSALPGEPIGTSYLLFIDDYFSLARDRDLVLKQMAEQLPALGSQDRMAVVAFDGRRLEMLSTWSQEPRVLQRVLEEARERHARGLERVVEDRNLDTDRRLRERSQAATFQRLATSSADMMAQERFYTELKASQVEAAVDAASAALRAFAEPPGRKVMILLSGGWPYEPANYVMEDLSARVFEPQVRGGASLFQSLVNTANLVGYTIYSVDVPGIETNMADVTREAPQGIGTGVSVREWENQFALQHLAQETGGEALLNGSRTDAFQRAKLDTQSYYWLGFSPERKGDDQGHDIKVKLRDSKYKTRYRAGFLDFSTNAEVTMAVESTLLFGNGTSDAGLHIEVGEARKTSRRRIEVPITVLVPLEALTVLPVGDSYVANVEIRIGARDERGDTSPISAIEVALTSGDEPRPGQLGRFETTLTLRRENHDVVVAAYDPLSGSLLSGTARVEPK